MPRTARIEYEGAIHHVTSRGDHREPLFFDDSDRIFFLDELDITARRYDWTWLAYCLMSNHWHLVLETPMKTLGLGMRRLASRHARRVNDLHRREGGHVFQGRYDNRLVESDEYFAQLLRYVARNPVKAKLCKDPADWLWSSHRHMLTGGKRIEKARARIEAHLGQWAGHPGGSYATLFEPNHALALKYGDNDPWSYRPPLEELLAAPLSDTGLLAARTAGYTFREMAAFLGVSEATAWRRTRRAAGR